MKNKKFKIPIKGNNGETIMISVLAPTKEDAEKAARHYQDEEQNKNCVQVKIA